MVITIFTDGSCNNRSDLKIGGYSCIVSYTKDNTQKIVIGGEVKSSSARMELQAVTSALEFIVDNHTETDFIDVFVRTDAQYIANSINKGWIWDWIKQDYANKKNIDLWKRIIKALNSDTLISFNIQHVKGHSGIELNEMADVWAGKAAQEMDKLYRENSNNKQFKTIKTNECNQVRKNRHR